MAVDYADVVHEHAKIAVQLYKDRLSELEQRSGLRFEPDGGNTAAAPEDVRRYLEAIRAIGGEVASISARMILTNACNRMGLSLSRLVRPAERSAELTSLLLKAVEQTGDAVLITDSLGVIQYVNPAFTAITGCAVDEVLGRTHPMLRHAGRPDGEPDAQRREAPQREECWRETYEGRKKSGECYWVEETISPIRGVAGGGGDDPLRCRAARHHPHASGCLDGSAHQRRPLPSPAPSPC